MLGDRVQETDRNLAEYLAYFFPHVNYHKLRKPMVFFVCLFVCFDVKTKLFAARSTLCMQKRSVTI